MNTSDYRKLDCCDLCGSGIFDVLASEVPSKESTLYDLGITSSYETVMCKSCGWIFKPGVLSDEQLTVLYGKYGGEATFNKNCERVSLIRSNELYSWVNKDASIKDGCSVLDIGGGIGQATSVFADKGNKVTVLDMAGGELLCENMELVKTTFYEYESSEKYDLIFMNHVAEHVWDPTILFSHSHELLSDTGFLYVEVPFELITPLIKSKLGDPCHVGYFSLHTLKSFFEKCDFEVIRIEKALGWYNSRRVMILRGIAKKKYANVTACTSALVFPNDGRVKINRIKMMREIFNISQMLIILRLIFNKVLSKVFR